MKEIQVIALLLIVCSAVLNDMYSGKISNGIIVTGILWGAAYRVFNQGVLGSLLFLGSSCLPILLFGPLYYFRMIGAGDIKLLCVVGGFLNPLACFRCIVLSILFGGLISLTIMIRRHNFCQRLFYFSDFIEQYSREKVWKSYGEHADEAAKFCFSVPVLLAVLCYVGGIY